MFDRPDRTRKGAMHNISCSAIRADHFGEAATSSGNTHFTFIPFGGTYQDLRAYGLTGALILKSVSFKLLSTIDENGDAVEEPIAVVVASAGGRNFDVWFQRNDQGDVAPYQRIGSMTDAVDSRFTLGDALSELALTMVQEHKDFMDTNTEEDSERLEPIAQIASFKKALIERMIATATDEIVAFELNAALHRPLPDVWTLVEAAAYMSVSVEYVRQAMDHGALACLMVREPTGERMWFSKQAIDDFWTTEVGIAHRPTRTRYA
ncbi:hypothetical protein [Paraburkholderia sp. BL21I4N1]|uniref:hypothetical protein n=1 Tax=Paraburkholderia sp. BL21I4N1 TaxID=1938801 RepID=UPI000D4515DE|nr:hypothetical protein [Paraburkholderia sp. BL21I4N1]PQV53432.1 hypothetical protein B0G83_102518 [Paraburkholderia sp. BL21I4N1]